MVWGLTSTKGGGSKDLLEIADLEDECVIKMRELCAENLRRTNVPLDA